MLDYNEDRLPTLRQVDPDHSWRDQAACAGVDPDLFFPERGGSDREAKALCATCPVRQPCEGFAMANRIEHGVWGGLSAVQRKRRWASLPRQRGAA